MEAAVLATIGTFLLGTLIGWIAHWVLHQRWAGRFYRAHLTHHRNYPPRNMVSGTYRRAGKDDSFFVFAPVVFVTLLAYCAGLWALGLPWWTCPLTMATAIFVGWLHEHVHEAFHLHETRLERFAWFRELRAIHFEHHVNARYNLGIIWFGWDRLLRTFKRSG
jgi:hypothetical protein